MNTPHTSADLHGNELRVDLYGRVVLKLASERNARSIGWLRGGMLHVSRHSSRHLHRKTKSYGFNMALLRLDIVETVALTEDGTQRYLIPKEVVLRDGKVMYFKDTNAGSFEVQVFLSRELMQRYRD